MWTMPAALVNLWTNTSTRTVLHHGTGKSVRKATVNLLVNTDSTIISSSVTSTGGIDRKWQDLLKRLTTADLSTEKFPFRHVAEIDIGLARVLCARITYVGELGYELFIPSVSYFRPRFLALA